MTAALSLHHVVKRFGRTTALADMTWSARHGQVTAVLGPNGAGKTTAIEIAEGLQPADAGQVQVLGRDPWRAPAEHRARVGVMLQDGGLPNSTRPSRLLTHLSRMHADPGSVPELTARLGIDAFDHTMLRRLSGGQRQRVALAAALIGRPEVVFLDEPTAGLDPHARLDVWDLIRGTAEAGCAVVVTTHSFTEAERVADHVVIINAGRVVADDTHAALTGRRSLEDLYFSLTRQAGR